MSGFLREWIAPVAEEKLGAALGLLRSDHGSGKSLEEGDLTYYQGVVTIHLTKGKCLQIVDFNGQDAYPSEVVVSDGHNLIQAAFSQDGIKLFEKQSGRIFSSIRGGTLNIRDFYLVFDPVATSTRKLTLRVPGFKFIGAEGSRTVGSPRHISDARSLQQIFIQLKRAIPSIGQPIDPQKIPSPQVSAYNSQSTFGDCPLTDGTASQAGFATQIENVTRERNVTSIMPLVTVRPARANLMSLLKMDHNPKATGSQSRSEDIVGESISDELMSVSKCLPRTPLAQVSNNRMLEITLKSEEAIARVPTSHPTNSSQSITSSGPKSESLPDSQQQAKSPGPSLPVPTSCERDNSQENKESYDQAPQVKSKNNNQENQQQRPKMAFIDQFQIKDPFQGLKRIPRKYLQIPKSQNAILEGDSWFDHSSNCSYASVPKDARDGIAVFLSQLNVEPDNLQSAAGSIICSQSEDHYRHPDIKLVAEDGQSFSKSANSDIDSEDGQSRISITHGEVALDVSNLDKLMVTDRFPHQVSQQLQSHRNWYSESRSSDEGCEPLGSPSGATSAYFQPKPGKSVSQSVTMLLNRNQVTPRYRESQYTHTSMIILSSSPAEEDEIELAVPHAIGDLVDESDDESHVIDIMCPELTKTALQDIQLVQVNQTPTVNSRSLTANNFQREVELDHASPREPKFDDPLSDPIIPATFQDVSPQILSACLDAVSWNGDSVPMSTVTSSNTQSPPKFIRSAQNDHIPDTRTWVDFEESIEAVHVEEQLIIQPANAQLEFETPVHSSNFHTIHSSSKPALSTPEPSQDLSRYNTQTSDHTSNSLSPETIDQPRAVSSSPVRLSHSPIGVTSQPPQAFSPRSKSRPLARSGPCRTLITLKRNCESVAESPGNKFSKRQKRRSVAAAILDEDDCITQDTKEMARASRHGFHQHLPAATKPDISSPILQVDSSIPSSSTPDQLQHSSLIVRSTGISGPSTIKHFADGHSPHARLRPSSSPDQVETVRTLDNIDRQVSSGCSIFSEASTTQSNNQPSAENGSQLNFVAGNSWDKFKTIYPDYKGSESHFTKTLVYAEWLNKQDLLLQSCLCDDFVRVFAAEYLDYIEQCKSLGTKPDVNGWHFYVNNIKTRLYQRDVITLNNLQEALTSLDVKRVEEYRYLFGSSVNRPYHVQQRPAESAVEDHQTAQSFERRSTNTRQGSVDGEHRIDQGEDSPKLESSAKATGSRKRFFETQSQLLIAEQRRPPPLASESARKSTCARALPWSSTSPIARSPSPGKISRSSSPASILVNGPPITSQTIQQNSRIKISRMRPPGSPILGRECESTTLILEDAVSRTTAPVTSQQQAPKPFCSPDFKSVPRNESKTGNKTPKEKNLVEGWLEGVEDVDSRFKNDRFWKFARKRLSSGSGFSSRASTPSSTPVKRFCTKPLGGASFGG